MGVAKHRYEVTYAPLENGAVGPPPADDMPEEILGSSLLERAGLQRRPDTRRRHDILDDDPPNLMRERNKPV